MIAGQAQGNKAPLGHDLSGGAFVFVQWVCRLPTISGLMRRRMRGLQTITYGKTQEETAMLSAVDT